jgi:hypothetical protein
MADPFAALDIDWVALCRRRRHDADVVRWASAEPALAGRLRLADVIPPPGVDRTPRFGALARLTARGDALAARALLQLLVPGLVRLANRLDSTQATAGAVVSAAWYHIARIQAGDVECRTPGLVLRSVRRDVIYTPERRRRRRELPTSFDPGADASARSPAVSRAPGPRVVSLAAQRSAEEAAWAEHLAIVDAARSAALSAPASRMLWETAMGVSNVSAVARHSGISVPAAHRLRARAFEAVRKRSPRPLDTGDREAWQLKPTPGG